MAAEYSEFISGILLKSPCKGFSWHRPLDSVQAPLAVPYHSQGLHPCVITKKKKQNLDAGSIRMKHLQTCQVYNRMLQQGDLARGSLGYGQHRCLAQIVGKNARIRCNAWIRCDGIVMDCHISFIPSKWGFCSCRELLIHIDLYMVHAFSFTTMFV